METHAANLPGLTYTGDLTDPTEFLQTLDVWGIQTVDLVAGGVPCQPFSRAGRSRIDRMVELGERAGHDARAHLWESFVAVVERLRPRAVLIENVPDLPRWDDGAVLIGFYESLRELGYTVDARVLDGFRFVVPQHRQRLMLIGLLEGRQPRWPDPSDEMVSLHDAIADLPIIPRAQRHEELPYDAARSTSDYQRELRRGLRGDAADVVWDHICRDVRRDDLEAFSMLEQGETYLDLPERLRRYRSDVFTDKYKRLAWNELCRSITAHIAKDGYWYIHPDQHRTLSIREAARVQTFPDDFRFAGTQTHRYRQIGNAVPVRLARAVGEVVREVLETSPRARLGTDSFRASLLAWHANQPMTFKWRYGAEPWHVLMAELALRRASPKQAAAVFPRLCAVAPTPAATVTDSSSTIRRLREIGLKTSSAEILVVVAGELVEFFGGEVPEDEMLLRRLTGVGDHVCQAVRCFGFGRRAVLLDRNTVRVSARLAGRPDARRYQLRLDLHQLAGGPGPDRAFNCALLDLGQALCRIAEPLCVGCPVRRLCATGSHTADDEQLPFGAEHAMLEEEALT